jgi:hypothetical protein
LQNTILANNVEVTGGHTTSTNCAPGSGIDSLGDNIDSGSDCGFTSAGGLSDTDPRLGPLQDNGGPTQTLGLEAGSPALDKVPATDAACPATDQRGVPRPQGPACDIGAFELAVLPANTIVPVGSTPAGVLTFAAGGVTPLVTALGQSASIWREGGKLAQISRKTIVPVGTTFTFQLNQPASVELVFTRAAPGRRVRGRCLTQSATNKHKPRCTRTISAGTLKLAARDGVNRILFYGRLSRTSKLKPGRHTVTITAIDAAGQHATSRALSFTIVR